MIEVWKDIKDYEGYQVSNEGNVKSLGNDRTRKEKLLKPAKNKDGYLRVGLSKNNKRKFYFIHRLVAQAFSPNPDNLPEINHRDEDKTNNNVANLEWCDHRYNNNYGTRNERVAEKTSKQVLCVETGVVYPSTHQVQRELGFAQSNISSACNGRYKTCGGFHWRYVS